MSEQIETPQGQPNSGGDGGKDAAYWQAEAKKAFEARDRTSQRVRELEGRALSEDDIALFQTLKEQQSKADEEKKRKAGEFDAWRADITKKHEESISAERKRAESAEAKYRQKLVGHAFASASSLFGDAGKTVLTPDIAEAYFAKHVEVLDDDSVVVKGLDGHVILNAKTGKPADFAEALAELIDGLPHKNKILRGSGKAGSGSPGGATTGVEHIDFTNLTPEQRRDPKVLAALRARQPRGGMVFGTAYEQ